MVGFVFSMLSSSEGKGGELLRNDMLTYALFLSSLDLSSVGAGLEVEICKK